VLGLSPDESSTLVFADAAGESRIGLGIASDGDAGLTVYDSDGARAPSPIIENGDDEAEVISADLAAGNR
jgi:hypothetical protein